METHKIENMHFKQTIIAFLTGLCLITFNGFAQQENFYGTWLLKEKKNILGPEYPNALPNQINLQRIADSIVVETVTGDNNGKYLVIRHGVALDGQPITGISNISQRKYIKSLKWTRKKKTFNITTVFYTVHRPDEIDFTRVDTFKLSRDGKQLMFNRKSIETRAESWEVTGMFGHSDAAKNN